jgi:hypothetical protein
LTEALKTHALTANLPESIIFDAGVLYKNFTDPTDPGTVLGATRGGSEFALNAEIREVEVDGAPGPVKGLKRYTRIAPTMTINLLSLTKDNLLLAIPGSAEEAGKTNFTDYDVITGGQITDESYFDNLALVARTGSGKPVIFVIENALADGNLSLSFADQDEANPSITFQAHFDPADLESAEDLFENLPFKIYYPKKAAVSDPPNQGGGADQSGGGEG